VFRQHGSRPVEPWLLQKYPGCNASAIKAGCYGPSGNQVKNHIMIPAVVSS